MRPVSVDICLGMLDSAVHSLMGSTALVLGKIARIMAGGVDTANPKYLNQAATRNGQQLLLLVYEYLYAV